MAWVNLLDIVYPVGSLYFTNNATSPAAIIGGSWTKIEEAAIRSGDTVGYAGEDKHAITIEEMPSHRHSFGYSPPFYAKDWANGGDIFAQNSTTAKSVMYDDRVGLTGGARDVSCSTFLQLFYLLSHSIKIKEVYNGLR